jgi:hypothetical protein
MAKKLKKLPKVNKNSRCPSEIDNQVSEADHALNKYHGLSMFQAVAGHVLETPYRRPNPPSP